MSDTNIQAILEKDLVMIRISVHVLRGALLSTLILGNLAAQQGQVPEGQNGRSPLETLREVRDQLKQTLENNGVIRNGNDTVNHSGHEPLTAEELAEHAAIKRAVQILKENHRRAKDNYENADEQIRQPYEKLLDEAQKELDASQTEHKDALERLESHAEHARHMQRLQKMLEQLENATDAETWNSSWIPTSRAQATMLEGMAVELVKKLSDMVKRARTDQQQAQEDAKKATTKEQAAAVNRVAALFGSLADQLEAQAQALIEAQRKQAAESVRAAQRRFNNKRQQLIDEAVDKASAKPRDRRTREELDRQTRQATQSVDRRTDIRNALRRLNAARRAYAEAEKKLQRGDVRRAIRQYSGIMRSAASVRFAAATPANDRRLALAGPGQNTIGVASPLVREADHAFVTPTGIQAYAGMEYLTLQGDLTALELWGDVIDRQITVLKTQPASPEVETEIIELTLVGTVKNLVTSTVNRIRVDMAGSRKQVAAAGSDVGKVADILTAEPTAGPVELELPDTLQTWINPEEFRSQVFDRFAATIAAQVAQQSAPQAGTAVVKGGAALDATSGTPLPGVTVKFTFQDEGPADPVVTQTQTITTNPQGAFQFELPPTARVTQVRVAGEDLISDPQQDADDLAPLLALGWSPEDLQKLTPEQRAELIQVANVLYAVLRAKFSGETPDVEELMELNAVEANRRLVSTVVLVHMMMLGDKQQLLDFFKSETLRRALQNTQTAKALAQAMEQAGGNKTDDNFFDLPIDELPIPFSVARKPEQIVVETTNIAEDTDIAELQTQIEQALRETVGSEARIEVSLSERKDTRLPVAVGGSSTVLNFTATVQSSTGAAVQIDDRRLNQNLAVLSGNNDNVRFAEAAAPRQAEANGPNDPHFRIRGTWGQEYHDQWAMRRVGYTELDGDIRSAWDAQPESTERCVVAVIGSGVDWLHPELLGQMWVNQGEAPGSNIDNDGNGYPGDSFGWNFRDGNADVFDYGGHDTHVAGVIAARLNNGEGIAGINPRARIMSLKVANYLGQANSIDISRAIFYAADHGARVINISYGGQSLSRIEQKAIDYAVAKGSLVVVAAGNEASDATSRGLSGSRGVLTVAGTTLKDKRSQFSNWGQPIDLAAPAMDILSLRARGTDFLVYVGENPNYEGGTGIVGDSKQLYRASGTSFAAPFISGTASLIWSRNPQLSAEQIRRQLLMSAEDVELTGWDQFTGHGVLDARRALDADPDYFLFARISQVKPVRRDGATFLEVRGQAEGSEFEGRWLQIGFGKDPKADAWTTVGFSRDAVSDGLLGRIPTTKFTKRGTWTLRILTRDQRKLVKGSRATLNLQ